MASQSTPSIALPPFYNNGELVLIDNRDQGYIISRSLHENQWIYNIKLSIGNTTMNDVHSNRCRLTTLASNCTTRSGSTNRSTGRSSAIIQRQSTTTQPPNNSNNK